MKRALILAVGFLGVAAVAASAQTSTAPQTPVKPAAGANFVDADRDGICDLFQAGAGQGQGRATAAAAASAAGRGGHGNRQGHLRRHRPER